MLMAQNSETAATTADAGGQLATRGRAVPDWVISERRARGDCERCGERRAATVWAGTGEVICWECCERKRQQGMG